MFSKHESLKFESIVKENQIRNLIPIPLKSFEEAMRQIIRTCNNISVHFSTRIRERKLQTFVVDNTRIF